MCNFATYSTQASYFLHDVPKKIQKKGELFVEYPTKIAGYQPFITDRQKETAKNHSFCLIFYKITRSVIPGKKTQKKEKQKCIKIHASSMTGKQKQEKYVIFLTYSSL